MSVEIRLTMKVFVNKQNLIMECFIELYFYDYI